MSLEKLAAMVGMSRQGMRQSMSTGALSVERLFTVARVLSTTPCDLVSADDIHLVSEAPAMYETGQKALQRENELLQQVVENQKARIDLLEKELAKGK